MTEPPNSGELETVWVESTSIYFMYEVKANVGHKSSNLEQKVGYLFHPVYTIGF